MAVKKKKSSKKTDDKKVVKSEKNEHKVDFAKKVLNNEDLQLTDEQKENAIKKEAHYRKLYNSIFDFNQTKDFKVLCKSLIDGYENMMETYKDKSDNKDDINYIIKFAFRDFYLLMFINMKQIFDEDDFLKDLHRKVYFSENYVSLADFKRLIDYCKEKLK